MQHLEGSGTSVLYIERKVLKSLTDTDIAKHRLQAPWWWFSQNRKM